MCTLRLLIFVVGFLLLAPAPGDAKISMYTDSSGKLHISNQGSEAPEVQPAPPMRGKPGDPGHVRQRPPAPPPPRVDQDQPEELKPSPPNRQNALSLKNSEQMPVAADEETFAAIQVAGTNRQVAPASKQKLRSRADTGGRPEAIQVCLNDQGVLCITNLPEKESTLAGAPAERRQIPDTPVAWEETPLAGQIIPAAHRSRSSSPPALPQVKGSILSQRDKKGVIRISNVMVTPSVTSQPAVAVLPARPDAGPVPPPAGAQPPALKSGGQLRTVAVQRDKTGRLRIYTKEPEPPLLAQRPAAPVLHRVDPGLAPIVTEAAATYRLPTSLILSVIKMESNFVPWAVSPKGAMGLMQLMPGTAADLGVQEPFCPRQNIMGGSRYLRYLLNCFNGSVPLAVAAYNAGPDRVVAAGYQVPEIKETQKFVSNVLELYSLLDNMGPGRRP